MTKLFKLIFLLGVSYSSYGQQSMPLLKANSKKIAIKDGEEGITRFWNHLEKADEPVVYPLAKNQGARKVVFYTDIDSITFQVEPNATYPFRVVVNNTDTCKVQLSTVVYKPTVSSATVSIPFKLKNSNQIIVNASVNNTASQEFLIDLGARYNYLIGKGIDQKYNVAIDGHVEDESVAGLTTEATSSSNKIDLGDIVFNNMPVCVIHEENDGCGLIGHRAFEGTILELNFDDEKLILHPALPGYSSSYTKIPIKQTTGGLYLYLTINNGDKKVSGWFFVDTGADNALSVDAKFAQQHQLFGTMKKTGEGVVSSSGVGDIKIDILEVPAVSISNYEFKDVPAVFAKESNAEASFEDGVIGIELLKKFNLIIDFANNTMYLKPNSHFSQSFSKEGGINWFLIAGIISLILGLIGYVLYKRKNAQK